MSYSLRGDSLGQAPSIGGLGDWSDYLPVAWGDRVDGTPQCAVGDNYHPLLGRCVKSAESFFCPEGKVYDLNLHECVEDTSGPAKVLPATKTPPGTAVVTKPDGTKAVVAVPVAESGVDLTTIACLALLAGGGYMVYKKKSRGY